MGLGMEVGYWGLKVQREGPYKGVSRGHGGSNCRVLREHLLMVKTVRG